MICQKQLLRMVRKLPMKTVTPLLTLSLFWALLGCEDGGVDALPARIAVQEVLDAGPVELGDFNQTELEISNTGLVAVNMKMAVEGDDSDAFEVIESEQLPAVPVGGSVHAKIVFRPTRLGPHTGEFRLSFSGLKSGSIGVVKLRGTGIMPRTDAGAFPDGATSDAGVEAPDPGLADAAMPQDASLPPIPDSGVHWRPLTIIWTATTADTMEIYEQVTTLELVFECGDVEGTYRSVPWSTYATGPREAVRLEATVDVLPAGRCKATVRGRDPSGTVIQWLTGYWGAPDRPYEIGRTEAHAWDGAVYHGVLAPQPDVQREGYVWILQGW